MVVAATTVIISNCKYYDTTICTLTICWKVISYFSLYLTSVVMKPIYVTLVILEVCKATMQEKSSRLYNSCSRVFLTSPKVVVFYTKRRFL